MASYKVGIAYEKYGYLRVDDVKDENEAVKKAQAWLKKATVEDMDQITEYLEDSEEVDVEGVFPIREEEEE